MDSTETDADDTPMKGDEYEYANGTTEIVYHVEGGRVLAFREYPDFDAFSEVVDSATYRGCNEDVASLPGPESFAADDSNEEDDSSQ